MIRPIAPQATAQNNPQQAQNTELPVKPSLDKKVINLFKNFEIKPTKGKFFALILLSSCLILLYAGLILLSKKPEAPKPPPPKKEVEAKETPSAKNPDFLELEKKVAEFNTGLDKLENFRTNYSPPSPDLNITFK